MISFESKFDFPYQKILGYAQCDLVETHNNYLKYAKGTNHFLLFNQTGTDTIDLFSTAHFKCVSKSELLAFLYPLENLAELQARIEDIRNMEIEVTSNSLKSIPIDTLIGYVLGLAKIDAPDSNTWYTTPQFTDRLFGNDSNFKIPLCVYNDRKFVRFVNYAQWTDEKTVFLNSLATGFFTSNFLPSNTKLLVCANPQIWKRQALTSTSSEYLYTACHPNSGTELFNELHLLYSKYSFSLIHVFSFFYKEELSFLFRFLTHYLNYYAKGKHFFIEDLDTEFVLQIYVPNGKDSVGEINSFIATIDLEVLEKFYDTEKDNYILNSELLKDNKIKVKRTSKELETGYTIRIKKDIDKLNIVLNNLLNRFLKQAQLQVTVYASG